MKKRLILFGAVAVTAVAVACGEKAATPVSPSPAVSSVAAASSADGSTLKATAPAPYSPANASVVADLTPNLVVANATLKYLGDVPMSGTMSYRFIVETTSGGAVVDMSAPTTGGSYAALGITGSRVPANLLKPETTYRWRARAELGNSFGPWSGYWTITTPRAPSVAPPAPTSGANDQIDLSKVIWLKGVNTSTWAITSTMIAVSYDAPHEALCLEHTAQGKWPRLDFMGDPANGYVEASQIIMANIGGQWYAGAADWLRPGAACAHVPSNIGPAKFPSEPPLSGWIPRPGEWVGFMVTTPSRLGQQGTAERTNVVLYQWR